MTPLAQIVAKQLTLPVRDRCKYDNAQLMRRMDDVHCFELTEVVDLVWEIAESRSKLDACEDYLFLPVPKTWIEFRNDYYKNAKRIGFLLEKKGERIEIRLCVDDPHGCYGSLSEVISVSGLDTFAPATLPESQHRYIAGMTAAALALINTPRIIGRRTHAPHRGLERKLLAQQKVIGKFPLHAWTEIILEVRPPIEAMNELGVEAHLTGRRALHFVRAHLRIRDGQLIFVSAHWRGDASLGIKQSRHKIVPPRDGSPAPFH